jgi:tRNA (adenine37-N6)-methyltransferase
MGNKDGITFSPIGIVKNNIELEGPKYFGYRDVISEIVLDKKYEGALLGIGDFSHLIIIFALHLMKDKKDKTLQVHPRGRLELPLRGVFATRSPERPNPIGITVVKLKKIDGSVLTVVGLDAINNSPVLDIKPYIQEGDAVSESVSPEWINKLSG